MAIRVEENAVSTLATGLSSVQSRRISSASYPTLKLKDSYKNEKRSPVSELRVIIENIFM